MTKSLKAVLLALTVVMLFTATVALIACETECEHEYSHWEETIAPTCTSEGEQRRTCLKCGNTYDEKLPALGHDVVHNSAKSATCTETGWNAYETCTRCNYSTYIEIPAIGHAPNDAVQENVVSATCTVTGTYDSVVYCSVCSIELSREVHTIEKSEHTLSSAVQENVSSATCTEDGSYENVVYCSVCNEVISRTAGALTAFGHTYGTWQDEVSPTCVKNGTKAHKDCSICHKHFDSNNQEIENLTISALGHDVVHNSAKSATCTEAGWNAYETCNRCNYSTYIEIPATGHVSKDAARENVVPATCSQLGSYDNVVYCSVCSIELSRKSEVIEKSAHTPSSAVQENMTPATCTESGSYENVIYCSVCSTELERVYETVVALGHTYGVWQDEVPATCATNGSKGHQTCKNCGKNFDANGSRIVNLAIPALDHYVVYHSAKSATCTEAGWNAYETCRNCDYSTYIEIPAKGHAPNDAVQEKVVLATCTSTGSYDNVVYCSVCSLEVSRKSIVTNELPHVPNGAVQENIIPATCTKDGSYENVIYCSVCNEVISRTSGTLTAFGHTYGAWQDEISPTCTKNGTKGYKDCCNCHKHFDSNNQEIENLTISVLDHDVVHNSAKSATCTEVGWNAYETCNRCDYSTYTEIPAKGHVYSIWQDEVSATCTKNGTKGYKDCSSCHKHFDSNNQEIENLTIPALGHDVVHNSAKSATCTEVGWNAYETCNRCDYSTYIKIPAKGHVHKDAARENVVPATCTEDGSYENVIYCSVCNEVISRTPGTLTASGHVYSAWQDEVSATCTESGTKGYKECSNCHKHFDSNNQEIENLTIPALGHDVVHNSAKSATCTEVGWNAYETCNRCDYSTYTEIPANGHAPNSVVQENVVSATCSCSGSYDSVIYCSVCSSEMSREPIVTNKLAHVPSIAIRENEKAATCIAEGSYDSVVYCSVCSIQLSRETQTIEKSEHTPSSAVQENVVSATCTSTGSYDNVVYCSVCNEVLSRTPGTLTALGHTYGTWQDEVSATCTESGTKAHKDCSICHKHFDANNNEIELAIVSTGHTFEDGTCTVCGEKEFELATGLEFTLSSNETYYVVTGIGEETKSQFVIPSTYMDKPVSAIGAQAFANLDITKIFIPSSILQIDSLAFYNCKGLTIYCESTTQPVGWASNWNGDSAIVWNYVGTEYSKTRKAFASNVVTEPVEGKEYTLALLQGENLLYALEVESNYVATTTDVLFAATVQVEVAENGYYLKLGDCYLTLTGTINEKGSISVSIELTDNGTVFTIGSNNQLLATVTVNEQSEEFFLGTYSTYTSISAISVTYLTEETIDTTQFPVRLCEITSKLFTTTEGSEEPIGTLVQTVDCKKTSINVTKEGTYNALGAEKSGGIQKTLTVGEVTIINDVGISSTEVVTKYDTSNIRCYSGSLLTISYTGMTSLVITTDSKHFLGTETLNVEGVQLNVTDNVLVVNFPYPVDSVTICLASQVRLKSVSVYH